MLKNFIVSLLLMLPNIAFSTSSSYSNTQLSDYFMYGDTIIVSFRVIDSQFFRACPTITLLRWKLPRSFILKNLTTLASR